MDHDAAHKYIYSLAEVTADLLRLVIPGWVDELDLSSLEDRSSEYLDDAHRKRLGDMAWRVDFRGGRLAGGAPQVLVLVEFQSEVDRRMAKRMREYAELLLERAARDRTEGRKGSLPCVLPIVVYNGSKPWTAAGQPTGRHCLRKRRCGTWRFFSRRRIICWLRGRLHFACVAGGGLAIGKPGVGDSASAGGRDAAGVAAKAAGGVGPLRRPPERGVPAGAAFLGAGAVGAQDRRWRGLPGF